MFCRECGGEIEDWVLDGWPGATQCSDCSAGVNDPFEDQLT